jgi:hypothetical protein
MAEEKRHTGIWWGTPKEMDHLQDLTVDGRITIILMLWKWDGTVWNINLATDKYK